MRADRLLSLLMLLQTRGKMTARELAGELEVSERTIYRDVEALSIAGVPIYGESGPEGGYALLDSYRTRLTGLSEGEVQALFMLSIPAPLADLGLSQELKAALLKLSASLPASRRQEEERVRQRFHLDATWWDREETDVPHLKILHRAVWQDRRVHLKYRTPFGGEFEWLADPYGLVAKAGDWYLIFASYGRIRAHRIAEILDVRLTIETFERPKDFNLSLFWESWCDERRENRFGYRVRARVSPDLMPLLTYYFGSRVRTQVASAGTPNENGWYTLDLAFDGLEEARARLLGLGRAVEVLAPDALRLSLVDFARQIIAFYDERT